LKGRKPHIFNIVSYPSASGILPSEEGGQINTAGVSSRVLTEAQIINARQYLTLKKVAVPFNPREMNSTLQLAKMVELGNKYNFDVFPVRIRPSDENYLTDLKRITKINQLSAIYLPSDSFLISKASEIISFTNSVEIPSICAVSAYMNHGCFVGTVADYNKLGKLAASIVDQHIRGTELFDIPVKFDNSPSPVVNEETRALLRLQ